MLYISDFRNDYESRKGKLKTYKSEKKVQYIVMKTDYTFKKEKKKVYK